MNLILGITKSDYDKKLQDIMDRIQTLAIEMEEHDCKTTIATVLESAHYSVQKSKTTSVNADRSTWLRIVEDVRTQLSEH